MDVTTKGADRSDTRLIKRYANRKLYDTQESRYVTLQQIAEFIREGHDVRIVDNRSKEDLTNVTLAQIIYEEEKSADSGDSRTSLLSFIQTGRDKLITSLPKFPFMGKDDKDASEDKRKDEEVDYRSISDDQVKAFLGTAMGHVQQLQNEVKRLEERIVELEARLEPASDAAGENNGKDEGSGAATD